MLFQLKRDIQFLLLVKFRNFKTVFCLHFVCIQVCIFLILQYSIIKKSKNNTKAIVITRLFLDRFWLTFAYRSCHRQN